MMQNPYESPGTKSPAPAAAVAMGVPAPFLWGLLLVGIGTLLLAAYALFAAYLSTQSTQSRLDSLWSDYIWQARLRRFGGVLVTMGLLLNVYLPQRLRLNHLAYMAAGTQLALLARGQWLMDLLPWRLTDYWLAVCAPSLAIYVYLLFRYSQALSDASMHRRCVRMAIVALGGLGLAIVCGFAATAGDRIRQTIGATWFIEVSTALLVGCVAAYAGAQLLLMRRDFVQGASHQDVPR